MIKLEIHFDTREELLAFLAGAAEAPTQEPRKSRGRLKGAAIDEKALDHEQEPDTTYTAPPPRARKTEDKPAPELDLKTVELPGEKLPEPEPVVALTYEEVSAALLGLAKRKGRDAAIELLSEYGVARLTDLDKAKWAAIKSHAEARALAP
jgi:hypothetical protein